MTVRVISMPLPLLLSLPPCYPLSTMTWLWGPSCCVLQVPGALQCSKQGLCQELGGLTGTSHRSCGHKERGWSTTPKTFRFLLQVQCHLELVHKHSSPQLWSQPIHPRKSRAGLDPLPWGDLLKTVLKQYKLFRKHGLLNNLPFKNLCARAKRRPRRALGKRLCWQPTTSNESTPAQRKLE